MFIYASISRLCSVDQLVYLDPNVTLFIDLITSLIISLTSGSLRTLCYFWYSRSFAIPYSTKKAGGAGGSLLGLITLNLSKNLGTWGYILSISTLLIYEHCAILSAIFYTVSFWLLLYIEMQLNFIYGSYFLQLW